MLEIAKIGCETQHQKKLSKIVPKTVRMLVVPTNQDPEFAVFVFWGEFQISIPYLQISKLKDYQISRHWQ